MSDIDPQEYNKYRAMGYTHDQIMSAWNDAVKELNAPSNNLQASYSQAMAVKNSDPRSRSSNTLVSGSFNENLIQWQLELDSILERVEHMLRGDKPTWDNGGVIWKTPEDDKERLLNNWGVAEIMRVLSMYVNRSTILSNYKEEVINAKMYDLGNELADLFYLKYESMGLNTLEKRKLYSMLVRELVDIVHSAYLRALHGGERESLRESRNVSQVEQMGGDGRGSYN